MFTYIEKMTVIDLTVSQGLGVCWATGHRIKGWYLSRAQGGESTQNLALTVSIHITVFLQPSTPSQILAQLCSKNII